MVVKIIRNKTNMKFMNINNTKKLNMNNDVTTNNLIVIKEQQ